MRLGRTRVLGAVLGIAVSGRADDGSSPAAQGATTASPVPAVELLDGRRVAGRVVDTKPGRYVIVERSDGKREAFDWPRLRRMEGKDPPPVPPPENGSLIPAGFSPERIPRLVEEGKRASDTLVGIVAPTDGTKFIGSIKSGQDVLEKLGIKRGPPNAALAGAGAALLPLCFFSNYGNLNGPQAEWMTPLCNYFVIPVSGAMLLASPFLTSAKKEMSGPSKHHVALSVYALDYSKKSALTGALNREPQGGIFGNNLGYDLGYTYIHPRFGLLGYSHLTLQQTAIARADYMSISNNFFKFDAQVGLDLIRLLSGGNPDSGWTQHAAFVRGGPSFFHSWIVSRDIGSSGNDRYTLDNPLNNSIGLVSAAGYEVAAEVDVRFPLGLGGVHFNFERGSYPSISFPSLIPRETAFVALVGFDDLRKGDTYTWQRLKLELELPLGFSRYGGFLLGGQLVNYENNFGSGVDNRGISLDYRWRMP